jgi:hypothetical protein
VNAPLPESTFESCHVVVYAADGQVLFDDRDCDVRVEPSQIVISYWDDQGAIVFSGRANDEGLYDLWCRSRRRRAEMRYAEESHAFEGTWREDEERGSWRIALPPTAPRGGEPPVAAGDR